MSKCGGASALSPSPLPQRNPAAAEQQDIPRATVAAVTAAVPFGLHVWKDAYLSNLMYLRDQVLPQGWQLNVVQKWDGYGHGIKTLAGEAARLGMPVSVLTNQEAAAAIASAAAAGVPPPTIRRIMPPEGPARIADIMQALDENMGIEELMSPINQADIMAAAAAIGHPIPVHIFMYNHYENPFGYYFNTTEQLHKFVGSLDSRLVQVKGIMMHTGGDTDEQAVKLVEQFNQVVCPVAQMLATPERPVVLHFASSSDIERLMPPTGRRIVVPHQLCQGPGIMWAARIGSLTYGTDEDDNIMLRNGTVPVMTWMAPITSIQEVKQQNGSTRKLAVVQVAPSRYPAPSWWADIQAYVPNTPYTPGNNTTTTGNHTDALSATSSDGSAAELDPDSSNGDLDGAGSKILDAVVAKPAGGGPVVISSYQPDSYVLIQGQLFRLASIPTDGSELLVDVTAAQQRIAVGEPVCIVCEERPLSALSQEVGADDYNTALCLNGEQPVIGTNQDTPNCNIRQ